MSTTVTLNANQYQVPAYQDTGYAQGTGNLSSYLISLATGCLTLAGGSFPLTADADFGASFGLKSLYYKSRATNVSSTGIVRLGNTEIIGWRNAGNGGDVTLSCNASDQISCSSDIVTATGKGFVTTTPDGTKTYRIYVDDNGELTTQQLT